MNPMNPENKNEDIEEIQNPDGELRIEHDINQAAHSIVNEIASNQETAGVESLVEDSTRPEYTNPVSTVPEVVAQPSEKIEQQPNLPIHSATTSGALTNVAIPIENRAKKPFSKLKLISIVLAVFLLICGVSASVFAGVYVPNKPNNVVKRSVANVFGAEYYNAVRAKLTVQSDGQMAEINTTAGKKDDITRANFGLKYSIFNVEGSVIYNAKDKSTYIKINGLDQLLNQFGSADSAKNTTKWVKLSDKDLGGTGSNTSDTDELKCLQGLLDLAKTNEFKNELLKTYTSNEFINAEKVGTDKIDDKKVGKYLLKIDNKKAEQFANQVENSSLINEKLASIDPKCNEDTKNSTNVISPDDDTKVENFYVWVNSSKQLIQLSFDISQSNSRATLQMNMLQNSNMDYSIPTNTVDGFDNLFGKSGQIANSLSL